MIRFEYNTHDMDMDVDSLDNSVKLEWSGEEEDIEDIIKKFKYFLLAKSYPPFLVNRCQYLTNNQMAKLKLLNEDIEES